MVNLGALNWIDSFIKMLKETLDCIIHVIYTPDHAYWPFSWLSKFSHTVIMFTDCTPDIVCLVCTVVLMISHLFP